ncbi:cystathionine gamma-synthase [Salinibacter ruber]|uniref:trans-sulfuration enzyme family protein n=1 Tax=Salinibacter ruber TaxID=146919 RepID=UPI002169A593|nr:PLP-dependent aspartate aminotransferase family protein [Salinibacter ruber]MCS3938620.1 cystathionine gamma-synthase [Salinibacter ruber]
MDLDPETTLSLAGQDLDDTFNSVVPPLYQSAIFQFEDVGETKGYDYTRSGNPTRAALEDTLADLDGGAGAVACATGMAAVSTVTSLFGAGAHLICAHDCYGGTERLFSCLDDQDKLSVSYEDLSDRDALADAVRPETAALWVETPSNPLLRIVDLEALSEFADAHDLLLIVDNTFLSPLLQRPIDYGADLVVYSTTKYLNGHSDVVGGAIIARTKALADRVDFAANAHGTVAAPFDSWLVLRGAKTLPVRLRQHETNARALAHFLDEHPAVQRVCYPGLHDHPGHEIARAQQNGYGGMVSFFVDDEQVDVEALLRSTEVFALAESLGGVESLIEHPATMSHASMAPEQREAAGITNGLIRLSVGIESTDDLRADLSQALTAAGAEAAASGHDTPVSAEAQAPASEGTC